MNREHIAPEHGWRETIRKLQLRFDIDPVTAFAFDYLESHGLRFAVHFGTKNAVELAQDEWLNRLEGRKA